MSSAISLFFGRGKGPLPVFLPWSAGVEERIGVVRVGGEGSDEGFQESLKIRAGARCQASGKFAVESCNVRNVQRLRNWVRVDACGSSAGAARVLSGGSK